MNDEIFRDACKEAWSAGYQAAIDIVKELAVQMPDASTKAAVEAVAKALEGVRP